MFPIQFDGVRFMFVRSRPAVTRLSVFAFGMWLVFVSTDVWGDTVTLNPSRDNTLFETTGGPETSAGAGVWLFTGRTGGLGGGIIRRSLFAFDLNAQIPPGSTIDSVSFTLVQLDAAPGFSSAEIGVHRTLADWGEGTSSAGGGSGAPATPGDATWTLGFFPDATTAWATPGGDYDAVALSTINVVAAPFGSSTWSSTPEFVAVVQEWLDDPSTNYGLLLRHLNESTLQTSVKWASSEDPFSTPVLVVEFTPPAGNDFIRGDCNTDGELQVSDPVYGLNALFLTGIPLECDDACDVNDDGAVDIADMVYLLEYLFVAGAPPTAPFPSCSFDPTADTIECAISAFCP